MPTELTPREAIIKLNHIRTNTGERPPEIDNVEGEIECPTCGMSTDEFDSKNYCFNCGQALEWE